MQLVQIVLSDLISMTEEFNMVNFGIKVFHLTGDSTKDPGISMNQICTW